MADEIRNSGIKGWIFASFFIFLILFVLMWAYIYSENLSGLVGQ